MGRNSSNDKNYSNVDNNLTNQVWVYILFKSWQPKSKILLSIASKMYAEGIIDKEQRGILKDLILQNEPNLNQFLNNYESGESSDQLFSNITKLIEDAQQHYK